MPSIIKVQENLALLQLAWILQLISAELEFYFGHADPQVIYKSSAI